MGSGGGGGISISISDSLKIYSFPTLLFLLTLFRLSLNISSTRLILTQGEAGSLIKTFGLFLTNGHLFVGLVIFFVLQVVQFLIIAKGSERVAEVAARFNLDALPGKQMSIDADLRAGLLTEKQARTAREKLVQESKFYGAMDGAMKFIKGESLAGFLILLINMIGGIAVGVFEENLSFSRAVNIYTVLSIGDGLAAQIPALILSMTAGILVTRVNSTENTLSLGQELSKQFFNNPPLLGIISLITFSFAFLPGFPSRFFLLSSLFSATVATNLFYQKRKTKIQEGSLENHHLDLKNLCLTGKTVELLLKVHPHLYQTLLKQKKWESFFQEHYPRLKKELTAKTGIVYPGLKLTTDPRLTNAHYQILIHEIPVFENEISLNHTRTVLAPAEQLLKALAFQLKNHSAEFLGIQEVKEILRTLEETHAELIQEVVPRLITLQKLTEILKKLAEEQVPIKDMRLILEILSQNQPDNKSPNTLVQELRVGMKKILSHQWSADGKLPCILVSQGIEELVQKHHEHNEDGDYLFLPAEKSQSLQKIFFQEYKKYHSRHTPLVVLTQVEIRRALQKLLKNSREFIPVLAFQELGEEINIFPVTTLTLKEEFYEKIA